MSEETQINSMVTTSEVEASQDAKETGKQTKTAMDILVAKLAKEISKLAKSTDAAGVVGDVSGVLNTIMRVNEADEYAVGIRVGNDLYRFDEYRCPQTFSDLVIAGRVVVESVPSAKNFLDKKAYAVTGNVLTPEDCALKSKQIARALRLNLNLVQLSRPSEAILADVAKYAVAGGKVRSAANTKLYYFNTRFDEEQNVAIDQWIKAFVNRMLD